jgi:DNA-binding NarL/FixJ family response regulator
MAASSISESVFSWSDLPSGAPERDPSVATQAIAADRCALTEVELALIWRELRQGLAVVVGGFFDETRCGLVLSTVGSRREATAPLSGRSLRALEAVLDGAGQKTVAIELDLAPSTVAQMIRAALERLGVSGKPSRVHPLLMLAATAARRHLLVPGTASYFTRGDEELQVIALPRPDGALVGQMPAAELEVVRALVEGRSYAEIACSRRTSTRTVANQIAAAFRRLRVSGRGELLQRLFVLSGWVGSASSPTGAPPSPAGPSELPLAPAPRITGVHRLPRLADESSPPRAAFGSSR